MAGNLIDITGRLKSKKKVKANTKASTTKGTSAVTDMTLMRQQVLAEERRQVKRTILTEFIGTHVVLPGLGLKRIALYDISTNGVSFDLEKKLGKFETGEEISMRIYLNHGAYFPFVLKVSNCRFDEDEGVYRHGANFVKGTVNEEALFHFVKFLETVSTSLKKDDGDILVSNLNK
jgi:competence protein ComGF